MVHEPLCVEITLARPGEWRVVERSHLTTQDVARIAFPADELSALREEMGRCLLDANVGLEAQRARIGRLGARLAELVLPSRIRERMAEAPGGVEFFLDDASMTLPVELFPCGDTVLAEARPVSRRWFSENARQPPKKKVSVPEQVLIVADPAHDLPEARNEGVAVLRRLNADPVNRQCRFLGRAVTRAELAWELPDADLLHLAAHYTAGGEGKEAGVSMADGPWMPSMQGKAPRLVFANCCRAGLTRGDGGSVSLVGQFLEKGSVHVVAPYLPVSDAVARRFAEDFYRAYSTRNDVAWAVWQARAAVGPAGWLYWHFGPIAESDRVSGGLPQTPGEESPTGKKLAVAAAVVVLAALLALLLYRAPGGNGAGPAGNSGIAAEAAPAFPDNASGDTLRPAREAPGEDETERTPETPRADERNGTGARVSSTAIGEF